MTAKDKPDFYLASTEHPSFKKVWRCHRLKRLRVEDRNDFLAIRVQPEFPGGLVGHEGRNFDELIIAPRLMGRSLFPVSEWPLDVHVCLLLEGSIEELEQVDREQLDHVAWAEIYRTEQDAKDDVV